jgi:alkanesulfonate monooxygenase SsuD/methylene tetrahydromethanopterin reductase-like flavin-dependent oxidoreductase (luciferase family)
MGQVVDVGIVLLSHHGCWDDAAYAEANGFATAGFVDSPLIAGDPFVAMALTARHTSKLRIGPMLAIPSNRNAPACVTAVASINRIAPGRTFLGIGTGFTGRAVFGLKALPTARLAEYAHDCRDLLDGREILYRDGSLSRFIRLAHVGDRYVDTTDIPIYVAADGPKALKAAGAYGDGWITTLQYSHFMKSSPDVLAATRQTVQAAAAEKGRTMEDPYIMCSAGFCVLEDGETPTSPRVLEHIGAYAMMPFHAYADNPAIAAHMPPAMQDRLDVYESEVLSRLDVPSDRRYQQVHRGHLSHLLDGEAAVLTDEIVRMTTLTGTAEEIVTVLERLQTAGLKNIALNPPPRLVRETVRMYADKIAPLLSEA